MLELTLEQDQQVKKLKRRLEGWRTILLPIRDCLVWEEEWYPAVTIGGVTLVFLILWLWNPSVLSGIAAVGLAFNFIDYTVPFATQSLQPSTTWTGQQERKFEEICVNCVLAYHTVLQTFKSFFKLRETSPRWYHTSLIGSLLLLAWIGGSINNLLLLYFFTCILVIWPALVHRGIPQTYCRAVVNFFDSRKKR